MIIYTVSLSSQISFFSLTRFFFSFTLAFYIIVLLMNIPQTGRYHWR